MTEKIALAVNRTVTLVGAIFGVAIPLITLIIYFAQIGPSLSDLRIKQAEQVARVDRIEASRQDGLQRLAKVEEAITSTKETLAMINGKLDEAIFGHRRR